MQDSLPAALGPTDAPQYLPLFLRLVYALGETFKVPSQIK